MSGKACHRQPPPREVSLLDVPGASSYHTGSPGAFLSAMSAARKPFSLAAATAAAGLAVWVLVQGYGSFLVTPAAPVTRALGRYAAGQSPGFSPPSPAPLTDGEFAALKETLVALDGPPASSELIALLNELVDREPFSPRMLELLEMRFGSEVSFPSGLLLWVLEKRLAMPGATALRLRMADAIREYPAGVFSFQISWCRSAGEGCSREEYTALREMINGSKSRWALDEGRSVALARRDPAEAVTFAMALSRESGGHVIPSWHLLNTVLDNIPPDTELAAIDTVLDGEGTLHDPFNVDSPRGILAAKWALKDPAESVAYILAHAETLPSTSMEAIVRGFGADNAPGAVAWVRAFPPGEYYDAAVEALSVGHASSVPWETLQELAFKMRDGEKRATVLAAGNPGSP